MSRNRHQKLLDDAQINAGLLREFLWKGLHAASIQAIRDKQRSLVNQWRVLRKLKQEIINESQNIHNVSKEPAGLLPEDTEQ